MNNKHKEDFILMPKEHVIKQNQTIQETQELLLMMQENFDDLFAVQKDLNESFLKLTKGFHSVVDAYIENKV